MNPHNHNTGRPLPQRNTLRVIAMLLLAFVLGPAGTAAMAADAGGGGRRSYAVVSLIGDKLTLVGAQQTTGSHIDRNGRTEVPLTDESFDVAALRAVAATMSKLEPQAELVMLLSKGHALHDQQNDLVKRDVFTMGPGLQEQLRGQPADQAIVITKWRAPADLGISDGVIGHGMLSGLGFYVDRTLAMQKVSTGERSVGFLSTYAYLRVSLIDIKSMSVLRSVTATPSTTAIPADSPTATHPWDSLDAAGKVHALEAMVRKGVDEALPKLLAGD